MTAGSIATPELSPKIAPKPAAHGQNQMLGCTCTLAPAADDGHELLGERGRLEQGPGKPGSPMQEVWMQKGWVQAHSHALWSKQSLVTWQVVSGPAAFGVRVLYISDLLLMLTWLRIWENASTLMVKKQHTVIPRPSAAEVFKDRAKWGGTGQKCAFLFAVHCISPGIQGVHLYSSAFVPK